MRSGAVTTCIVLRDFGDDANSKRRSNDAPLATSSFELGIGEAAPTLHSRILCAQRYAAMAGVIKKLAPDTGVSQRDVGPLSISDKRPDPVVCPIGLQ